MKKIILLGLMVIGAGAAGTSARAGGFSIGVVLNPFRLPVVLPPPPPIFAPAVVVSGSCAPVPVVRTVDCNAPFRPAPCVQVEHRVIERHDARLDRRDAHVRHDRF